MKIGILTFHTAINIGAQLQAFALNKILKTMCDDVEFIRYEPKYLLKPYTFFRNVKLKNGLISCIKQVLLHIIYDTLIWSRTIFHYKRFQKRYFKFSDYVINEPNQLLNQAYDIIIVGSDQIWNPEITDNCIDQMYTLNFQSNHIKKISYAASFSLSHITKDKAELLIERLKSFQAISVRESDIYQYLSRYSSLNIDVVLDPTLLLTKDDWLKYISKKRMINNKYVLVYQARGDKKCIIEQAEKLAKKLNVEVYDASGMNYRIKKNSMQYVNPIEFLNLIYYAEAVVTVSFHGTALSIILERPFFSILLGDGRDSRVCSLLDFLNLKAQQKRIGEELVLQNINFNEANLKLKVQRNSSLNFLAKNISN